MGHSDFSVYCAVVDIVDIGSITIFKNGERLGVAYSNVTGELRPCVDLFDYGDRVRMLKTSRPF